MDILVETVRDEIGACLEKSYEKISLQEAAKRLNLKSKEEVKVFGEKVKCFFFLLLAKYFTKFEFLFLKIIAQLESWSRWCLLLYN